MGGGVARRGGTNGQTLKHFVFVCLSRCAALPSFHLN